MKQKLLLASALVLLTACPDPDEWTGLSFTLGDDAVAAGTAVLYTAQLVGSEGERRATSVTLSSDLEPGLAYTETDLTPTVVGEHLLTATATVDGEIFTATASLVVTTGGEDRTPPEIEIASPERGAWSETFDGVVEGRVTDGSGAVGEVTVNGAGVSLAADGSFSASVAYEVGTNVVVTTARDGSGNVATDHRGVLAGSFILAWEPSRLPGGIAVRLNGGAFDGLAGRAAEAVTGGELLGRLPSPLADELSESCTPGPCATDDALRLEPADVTIAGLSVDLDPTAAGVVEVVVSAEEIALGWAAQGVVEGADHEGSGTATVASATVAFDLAFSPGEQGGIGVAAAAATVERAGLVATWDPWMADAATALGLDLDAAVGEALEQALEEAATDGVRRAVGEAVQGLEVCRTSDGPGEGGGSSFGVRAAAEELAVDDEGLSLSLETEATPEARSPGGLGVLSLGAELPASEGSSDLVTSLSIDLLNQLLYEAWAGLGMFGTDWLLPPVVLPGGGEHALDLRLADEPVRPAGEPDAAAEAYLGFDAGLTLSLTGEGGLDVTGEVLDVWCDAPGGGVSDEEAAARAAALLDRVVAVLGQAPVQPLAGFGLGSASVAAAPDGHVEVSGALEPLAADDEAREVTLTLAGGALGFTVSAPMEQRTRVTVSIAGAPAATYTLFATYGCHSEAADCDACLGTGLPALCDDSAPGPCDAFASCGPGGGCGYAVDRAALDGEGSLVLRDAFGPSPTGDPVDGMEPSDRSCRGFAVVASEAARGSDLPVVVRVRTRQYGGAAEAAEVVALY